jgi:dTDP-4-amino-4,6-dideoxy-D-galactose acyltransferase
MLPWDSEQLGTSAARVDCLLSMGSYNEQRRNKEILLDQLVSEAQDRRVRHLSARVDASDLSSLHVLEKADFITLDGILTYALSLAVNPSVELPGDFRVRLATVADAEETATLARTAFVYDRYHADPFITREQADELHAAWLRNSCTGEAADAVLVAEDQEGLLGFTSCSLPRDSERRSGRMVGTIILVASAQRARCRGVAHATMMAAVEWLRQQGCEIVESGTQLRNIPSSQLFRKCGFVLVGSSLSLRRLLSE